MKDVLQLYVPQIAWVCTYFLSHPPSHSEEVAKNEALWINCRSIFLEQGGGPQLSQERTDAGTQAMPQQIGKRKLKIILEGEGMCTLD
jgi:hypothetical protein